MSNDNLSNSSDSSELSGDLRRFAAELSQLRPREDRLDRERLAFLAGQASIVNATGWSRKVPGIRAESRAWSVAFAVMSVVAASLLFLLITQPDRRGDYSFANSNAQQRRETPGSVPANTRDVLTTQDACHVDLEERLASLEADRQSSAASIPLPQVDRVVPVYTPAAWQQVINESAASQPLPRKSSDVSRKQGINT